MSGKPRPEAGWLWLRIAGAGLLFASAGLHLDLYLTGYRTIPTIGWLFLLQVIAGFALGGAVLLSRSRLAAAAGAGLAISTLGGYLLTVQFGLFGFREVRTTAGITAGILDVAAFAVLGVLAARPLQGRRLAAVARTGPGSPAQPGLSTGPGSRPQAAGAPGRGQHGIPHAGAAVAGASVVALALLGGALAGAGSPAGSAPGPAAGGTAGAGLQTARIGGT